MDLAGAVGADRYYEDGSALSSTLRRKGQHYGMLRPWQRPEDTTEHETGTLKSCSALTKNRRLDASSYLDCFIFSSSSLSYHSRLFTKRRQESQQRVQGLGTFSGISTALRNKGPTSKRNGPRGQGQRVERANTWRFFGRGFRCFLLRPFEQSFSGSTEARTGRKGALSSLRLSWIWWGTVGATQWIFQWKGEDRHLIAARDSLGSEGRAQGGRA